MDTPLYSQEVTFLVSRCPKLRTEKISPVLCLTPLYVREGEGGRIPFLPLEYLLALEGHFLFDNSKGTLQLSFSFSK